MNLNRKNAPFLAALAALTAVLLLPYASAAEVGDAPTRGRDAETELISELAALKSHIQGTIERTPEQIDAQKRAIDEHKDLFDSSAATVRAGLDLVATYDEVKGPLFVARGGGSTVETGCRPTTSTGRSTA